MVRAQISFNTCSAGLPILDNYISNDWEINQSVLDYIRSYNILMVGDS